jgi:hypothetical protein
MDASVNLRTQLLFLCKTHSTVGSLAEKGLLEIAVSPRVRTAPCCQLKIRVPIVEHCPNSELAGHDVVTTDAMDPQTCDVEVAQWKRILSVAGRHLLSIRKNAVSVDCDFETRREVQAVTREVRVHSVATAGNSCGVAYGAVREDSDQATSAWVRARFQSIHHGPVHYVHVRRVDEHIILHALASPILAIGIVWSRRHPFVVLHTTPEPLAGTVQICTQGLVHSWRPSVRLLNRWCEDTLEIATCHYPIAQDALCGIIPGLGHALCHSRRGGC